MSLADNVLLRVSKFPNWFNKILLHGNIFGGFVYGIEYQKIKKRNKTFDSNKSLIDTVNFAIKNVKYYRDRYKGIIINTIEEFETKIGFIDKNEVMRYWDDFLVDNIDLNKCAITTTGGTSGKPLKIIQSNNRYAVELAFIHSIWNRAGWRYNKRGVIRNHKLPNNQTFRINPITKEYIFDAFRMSPDYAKQIHTVLSLNKIHFIQAYPSAAFQFCRLCQTQNLDLSFIKAFLCGSEAVTEEQHRFINGDLGIPIMSWYGHSEKLVLGGYCEGNNAIHIEPSYGYFELLKTEYLEGKKTSEFGEIVGTTLYNHMMPLIRYKTGDFADYAGSYCSSCDRHLPILNKIYGRWDKSIIYREDGTTTSITALNLHDNIYSQLDGIQYIQEKKRRTYCIGY